MPRSPTPASTIGVLVCDDSDPMRALLSILIDTDPDLRVAGEARNGQEAIDQAARLQPDVVLLDLSMPVLTGLAALPAIRAAAQAARVIALTGLSGSVVKEAVMAAGADDFIEKGAHPDVIVRAIKQGVHGRTDTPSRAAQRPETAGRKLIDSVFSLVFSKR